MKWTTIDSNKPPRNQIIWVRFKNDEQDPWIILSLKGIKVFSLKAKFVEWKETLEVDNYEMV